MDVLDIIQFKYCGPSTVYDIRELITERLLVSPSTFMAELQMTTEERLKKIKTSEITINRPPAGLNIFPNCIIFQNCTIGLDYYVPVSIINSGKNPCGITLYMEESPYVKLIIDSPSPSKLAPGMEIKCKVQFIPQFSGDYIHYLQICSAEVRFSIQIIVIGPRPMLTFPDNVILDDSLVDIGTEKHVLVKNIGDVQGSFRIICGPNFSVEPVATVMQPGTTVTFLVKFCSKKEGVFKEFFKLRFDSGEILKIGVEATAKSSNVLLSKPKIIFEDTYIGLTCHKTVEIQNCTDHMVRFAWKKFNSKELDYIEGEKIKEGFEIIKDLESRKNAKLEQFQVIEKDMSEVIYDRIYKDELIDYDNSEHLLYRDEHFSIIPLVGEIYPNHSTEVTLVFSPHLTKDLSSIAYCEATAKLDRLPLSLLGCGIGPKLKCNIDTLELNDVFLFAEVPFQVVFYNEGDVPSHLLFSPTLSFFDVQMKCVPESLYLKPFEHGEFTMHLKCTKAEYFAEEINFLVKESGEIMKISVTGHGVYARLLVDPVNIDFDIIAIGIHEERKLILQNVSPIDIPYSFSINTGRNPCVTLSTVKSITPNRLLPVAPKEFTIVPMEGICKGNGSVDVLIQLTPNILGNFETILWLDSWSSESHKIPVKLTHMCCLPKLYCKPSNVNIRFSFLNYLCHRIISIKNKSGLPGYIWLYTDENSGLQVSTCTTESYIYPFENLDISMNIICTELGKQQATLKYCLFGGEEEIACSIECIGQGPVVQLLPEQLNFDQVNLLQTATRSLSIFNDSPTEAEMEISVKNPKFWSVSQKTLQLQPEETKQIEVSCYLMDTVKYTSVLACNITKRGILECQLVAKGVGTSIQVTPKIEGVCELGPHLTKTLIKKKFLFKNCGTRHHKIIASPQKAIKSIQTYDPSTVQSEFKFDPAIFSIKPQEEIELVLTIYNKKKVDIQEDWFFHAIIENIDAKQVIIQTNISINFVDPTLYLSKLVMNFRIDRSYDENVCVNADIVQIVNISPMPLEIDILATAPFYMLANERKIYKLTLRFQSAEKYYLTVYFDASSNKKKCSVVQSRLQIKFHDHSNKEFIKLCGQINNPSVSFNPNQIDFVCTSTASSSSKLVELKNLSPLRFKFNFQWYGKYISVTNVPQLRQKEKIALPVSNRTGSSELSISLPSVGQRSTIKDLKKGKGAKGGKNGPAEKADKKQKKNKGDKGGKDIPGKGKKLLHEIVFEHYYTEKLVEYQNIQICQELHGPLSKDSLIGLTERNVDNLQLMKQNLFAAVRDFPEKEANYELLSCVTQVQEPTELINKIIDVVPFCGVLEPFETQIITLTYTPDKFESFTAKLICNIMGGPEEYVDITGSCTNIHYELESTDIQFGRQIFNEISEKQLYLKNTGLKAFTFTIKSPELDMNQSTRLLEVGWCEVEPKCQIVHPAEFACILIKYTPGISRKFVETFDIEIENFETVTVTVTGYGVFPQVYLSLPRPNIFNADDAEVCYNAIANLTSDFLAHVEQIKDWNNPEGEFFPFDFPNSTRKQLRKEGWVIVTYDRKYPSKMDIDLTIERYLACRHIMKTHSQMLDNPNILKSKHLPLFTTPPYILDFNYIVIDTVSHYTINILNYGPTKANVQISRLIHNSGFFKAGFNLQLNKRIIESGNSEPLHIIFCPTTELYPERETEVNVTIYLDVYCGPRIPIQIKALITKPFLKTNTTSLQFETVALGTCKVMNIILKNESKVPVIWEASIFHPKCLTNPNMNKNILFFLNDYNGRIDSHEVKMLDITFEPTSSIHYDWRLKIMIQQSDEQIIITLNGDGCAAQLKINEQQLWFEPCLPYDTSSVVYFNVKNPCLFPIEFYFPEFDKQIQKEESILTLLCEYYSSNKLYIPQRFPGEKLPYAFFEFLNILRNEFKQSMSGPIEETTLLGNANGGGKGVKKVKKKKVVETLHSSKSSATIDPFINKSTEELTSMLKEFIKSKLEIQGDEKQSGDLTSKLADPIKIAFIDSKRTNAFLDTFDQKVGTLIICHGAPYTEYLHAANRLARKLSLPIYSLDDLIIEALVYSGSMTCLKINEIINDAFQLCNVADLEPVEENPMKLLKYKLHMLQHRGDSSKKGSEKNSGKASKSTKSADSKKNPVSSLTFLNIPQELLIDLLKQKYAEFRIGLVIESLHSFFIPLPILTLYLLLQASTAINKVVGVFSFKTHQQYKQELENQTIKESTEKSKKNLEMLQHFDEISDSELDNLPPEHLDLYKNEYIAMRKESTARRLEILRVRKIIKQSAKVKGKKKGKVRSDILLTGSKSKKSLGVKISKKTSEKTGSPKSPKKRLVVDKKQQMDDMKIAKEYETFSNLFFEVMHIFEYWDRESGTITKEYVPKKPKLPQTRKKSSEKNNKKTVKSPPSTGLQNFETILADPFVGIPFWVVTNSSDILRDYEIISSQLKCLIHYNLSEKTDKVFLDSETFSIVCNPRTRIIPEPSSVFSLFNVFGESIPYLSRGYETLDEAEKVDNENHDINNGANMMSISGKLQRKKRKKSRTRTSVSKISKSSAILAHYLDSRIVLEPNQVKQHKIQFEPKKNGRYECIYEIEISGTNTVYQIHCIGDCDIPSIDMDPKSLYSACVMDKTLSNKFASNVFVESTGFFDFGAILLCSGSIEDANYHSKEAYIHLKNMSLLPCEVIIDFIDKTGVFRACREMLYIFPGHIETLILYACPAMLGENTDTLALSTKHNPRVELIPLTCEGCILRFETVPKKIIFERVPLHLATTKHLKLSNNSLVPVNWQFTNVGEFQDKFQISPINGILKPFSTKEITVEYLALISEIVTNKKLHLEVHREMSEDNPLLKDTIEISAETSELIIKCEKHINFGEIKVKKDYSYNYVITNDGKYNALFELTKINYNTTNRKKENIVDMFEISQTSGILTHQKPTTLIIKFCCNNLINISDFPIYSCNILDDITRKLMAKFCISVSMKTNYSKFNIYPFPNIHFRSQLVGTEAAQKIVITNTGSLEFSYYVLCKRTLDLLQAKNARKTAALSRVSIKTKSTKSSKKSSKTSVVGGSRKSLKSKESVTSKKTKESKMEKTDSKKSVKNKESVTTKKTKESRESKDSKKGKGKRIVKMGPTLICGIFIIKNSKNTVYPGEKAELEVICHPTNVGSFEETLIVFVSETGPKDRMGKILTLKGTPCLPSLDFTNLESIFKDQFIVETLSSFEKPAEIGNHCIFITKNRTLQFEHVCIYSTASTRLQLYNNGFIGAEVSINCSSPSSVFTVPVKTLYIPSYSHATFRVEFSPTELEKYSGNLDIKLIMPVGFKDEDYSIILSGRGTVPQITLRIPDKQDYFNTSEILLDPTFINTYTSTPISFENTGLYPCTVIVEVFEDPRYAFSLNIMADSLKFLLCPDAHATDHFKKIKFSPGHKANFELVFNPIEIDYFTCIVKIHIINNPFEIFTVHIQANCFSENVVLLDIPRSIPINSVILPPSDINLLTSYGINYHLDFGLISLKTLYKRRFKIANKSEEFNYKFAFRSSIPDIRHIPSVGHLVPGSCKDIIVTYLAEEATRIEDTVLDCVICKINYKTPFENDISWDDRQKLLLSEDSTQLSKSVTSVDEKTDDSSCKLFEANSEPDYEFIKDSIVRIPIFFSVVANYSTYECNVTDVELPDTFIYETQIFNFDVLNTGEVNLEIKWEITVENVSNFNLTFIKKPPTIPRKRILDGKARPLTGHEKFIGDRLTKYIADSRASISSENPLMPFKIEPTHFIIPPNTNKQMCLHFCPLEIYEYKAKLMGSMTNLCSKLENIKINIKAQSLAASCHFDAQFSDYITSGRRFSKSCDTFEINSNTKVVEFDCLGVGIKHDYSFNIINPTDEDLYYSWRQIKSYELSSVPLFSCVHEKGVVVKEKQFPATFSVFPQKTGLFEALYNFKIEKYNIDIPFLLVARVRAAKVNFSVSNIYLKPTVLGIAVHDSAILKNNEDVDIHFKFRKTSFYSEGRRQFVTVEPRKGCLKGKSETKITIHFNPTDIGDESFILKCKVDFAQKPLCLGLTTKCYAVEVLLRCLIAGKTILLSQDCDNVLDLGEILPQQKEKIIFYVRNQGKIGFYYCWKYNDDFIDEKFDIKLNTLEGYVKMNSELPMNLYITPRRNATLKNFRVELQVRYGPTYKILLNTAVTASTYKFSFLEFDFGPCFVQNSSICYYHKTLEVYNQGVTPITIELTFFNQEHLTVDFRMKTILPKIKEFINICFHPKKIQKYKNELIFAINNKITKIVITGEGIALNIGLVNIEDKTIDFGSPAVGTTVIKAVKVINKSLATVTAIFDIWSRLPIVMQPLPPNTHYLKPHKKQKIIEDEIETFTSKKDKKATKPVNKKFDKTSSKKSKSTNKSINIQSKPKTKNKVKAKSKTSTSSKKLSHSSRKSEDTCPSSLKPVIDTSQEEFPETKVITVTPTSAVTIFPNKTSEFFITYFPSQKIPPFTNKVSVQVLEMVQPLCIIKGSCTGPSFFLDREEILFGVVVQNCSTSIKVLLHNEGDISSRFHWVCENKDDFSFTPMQGYSAAGIPTIIDMHYHPTRLNTQSTNVAHLVLDALKTPLSINLAGLCANIPDPIGTIYFECCVRGTSTETVTIVNNSMQPWKLYPQLNSDCFTCPHMIRIHAKGNYVCEIVYSPLKMTKKEPHKATLFIKIPDGQALVYELEGKANMPEPVKSLYIEVHCKTLHKEVFPVHNWTQSKQTFKVFTEDITINSEAILYEINGQETLIVHGDKTRKYAWYFYAYKEGSVEVRVIFMNDEKEYLFYQVLIKVIKCKTIETIDLSSCIRVPKIHKLLLTNPLDSEITYKLTSNSYLLSCSNTISVPPHSELHEDIEYLPILCEESHATLEATCAELGSYIYEFKLKGEAAIPEPAIIINIFLGKQKTVNVTLKNFTKLKAIFNNKIGHATAFIFPKAITLNFYQSISFPLIFFPHEIGKIITTLSCQSSTAGDYEYPIIANCLAPTPKGPLRVKANASIFIEFTNPFLTDEVFNYFIEPDAFVLMLMQETIKSRSTIKIQVKLNSPEEHCKTTGKLVVSAANDENIKWIFYLEQE